MVLLDLGSDIATPPWLPLGLVIVLLVVLGLLFWSLRGHLRKINVDDAPREG